MDSIIKSWVLNKKSRVVYYYFIICLYFFTFKLNVYNKIINVITN